MSFGKTQDMQPP